MVYLEVVGIRKGGERIAPPSAREIEDPPKVICRYTLGSEKSERFSSLVMGSSPVYL